MRQAPGVGLAAPQIDISQRVIVVEYAEEEGEKWR
jgi:peptide deformylase